MVIDIEDNGVGIYQNIKSSVDRKALGSYLTQQRLKLLEKLMDQDYKINIEERISNTGKVEGTRVRLILPLSPSERKLKMIEEDLEQ